MKTCSCGSMAINPHCHGREPGVDLDLCDVCYWRARCGKLIKERAEMVAALRHAEAMNVNASAFAKWLAEPTTRTL
jgi:hypothetical protein